jgi:hypothetical protein
MSEEGGVEEELYNLEEEDADSTALWIAPDAERTKAEVWLLLTAAARTDELTEAAKEKSREAEESRI